MSGEKQTKIVNLRHRRSTKQYEKMLSIMSRYVMPWKVSIKPGTRYITVDENGMVYGRITELYEESRPDERTPPLLGKAVHYSDAHPDGVEEEIFTALVWGLLTEEQFDRAEKLGWPSRRGVFLDHVVTDDPRYTILFHPSDYEWKPD